MTDSTPFPAATVMQRLLLVACVLALGPVLLTGQQACEEADSPVAIPDEVLGRVADYLPHDPAVLARFAAASRQCRVLVRDRILILTALFDPFASDAALLRFISDLDPASVAALRVVVPDLDASQAAYLAQRLLCEHNQDRSSTLRMAVQVLVGQCGWSRLGAFLIGTLIGTLNPSPMYEIARDLQPYCNRRALARLPPNDAEIVEDVLAHRQWPSHKDLTALFLELRAAGKVDRFGDFVRAKHMAVLCRSAALASDLFQCGLVLDLDELLAEDVTLEAFRAVAPFCTPYVQTSRYAELVDRGRGDLLSELFRVRTWLWDTVADNDILLFYLLGHIAIKFGLRPLLEAVLGTPWIVATIRDQRVNLRRVRSWWPEPDQDTRLKPLLILLQDQYGVLRHKYPRTHVSQLPFHLGDVVLNNDAFDRELNSELPQPACL